MPDNYYESISRFLDIYRDSIINLNEIIKPINLVFPMLDSINELQKQMTDISDILYPLKSLGESISQSSILMKSNISAILEQQTDILQSLSSSTASILNIPITIATYESSLEFKEVSIDVLEEFNTVELSDEIKEHVDSGINSINSKEPLSLDTIIAIISLIIGIIVFIQSQLPNKQLESIENSLEQLIEIETETLNLLKKDTE